MSATLPESRVTEFSVPASNRGVTWMLGAPGGGRDSSIRLPAPASRYRSRAEFIPFAPAVVEAGLEPVRSATEGDPRSYILQLPAAEVESVAS